MPSLATILPASIGPAFPAHFAGADVLSGIKFWPGDVVHACGHGYVMASTLRLWEVTRIDGQEGSRYAPPVEATVMGALDAGKMVSTINGQGIKVYWMKKGDKVEETSCLGGPTMRWNRKSPSAFWNTVASKAQAARVHG